MNKPDIIIRGIRFHYDYDSEEYEATVTPEDLENAIAEAIQQQKEEE